MKIARLNTFALIAAGTLLAACDGGTGTPPPVVVPPPVLAVQDTFGSDFSAAFRASPNSDAVDITPNLPPVSFTTDPTDF